MNGKTKPVPSIERKFPARNSRVLPESRDVISSSPRGRRRFLSPTEVVLRSRGTALGASAPTGATPVNAINKTLNVEFDKLSEGE